MLVFITDVTQILSQIDQGDSKAAQRLLPLVHEELRNLAAAKMRQEKPGQTLQGTALVHEAHVRLVDQTSPQQWNNRGHFFAAAAEAMRRILVESARRKGRRKRGADYQRSTLGEMEIVAPATTAEILAVDDALTKLGVLPVSVHEPFS